MNRPLTELHAWENNPRNVKREDLDRLKAQLELKGQYKPLLVMPDGTVLGGNMRLKALQELALSDPARFADIWVSEIDFIQTEDGLWRPLVNGTEQPERFTSKEAGMFAFALSDNDRVGFYDSDLLANMMPNYDLDYNQYAIDLDSPITLQQLVDNVAPESSSIQEDETPEIDETEPPKSELGKVYQLGRHRLMCGDSRRADHMQTLLDNQIPQMVFTDPPYGVDYSSRVDEERRKGWGGIAGDELKGKELEVFLKDSVGYLAEPKYICCNWQSVTDFFNALGKPNALIVWDKGSIGLGAGYRNQHEFILFYGTLDNNDETNVWKFDRDSTGKYTHPTQKPVFVPARAIRNSSKVGDIVLDVFAGSGSTLLACEQMERTCYAMEIEPKYCDVIRKRYAKYRGDPDNWEAMTPVISSESEEEPSSIAYPTVT